MKKLILGILFISFFAALNLNSQAQILDSPPQDGLFADEGLIDKKPIPYPPLRKADVMWSKRIWRVIDMKHKMNQPFYYPVEPHNNWRSFIRVVMDALKEGSITAYDVTKTDEFTVPLTFQEVINRQTDSVNRVLTRPYPPYEEYDTVIYTEFNPEDVYRVRIKEDWYFDRQRSQLMVRIVGVCPVLLMERDGEEIPQPLFWVYYPEARPVFAKSLVYNEHNDAERRSYDEVFIKRMFSSFIYKEQNVYDRRISEYATGLDALLEAERIKNEVFEFEHDLWEF